MPAGRLLVNFVYAQQVALVGRLARDARSHTALAAEELEALLAHPAVAADLSDSSLDDQLAVVEACDVFLAPQTGFGMAALALGTPWPALSGGRWLEFCFNRVPFRSVIPDTRRYPCFGRFDPVAVVDDGDGPRTPSMSRARREEDLERDRGRGGPS
jgi:hypothetical protein